MEKKYKIVGLYYTRPRIMTATDGSPVSARYGVTIEVNRRVAFVGDRQRPVESITYVDNYFKITLKEEKDVPNGLLVIPMLPDTEVFYEEIK